MQNQFVKEIKEMKKACNILIFSRRDSSFYFIFYKTALILLGLVVLIIGITIGFADSLQISNSFKSILAFISALLGAFVTFINTNFDPSKFKQREIELTKLINEFTKSIDYFEAEYLNLNNVTQESEKFEKLENLKVKVRDKKNELIEKATSFTTKIGFKLFDLYELESEK